MACGSGWRQDCGQPTAVADAASFAGHQTRQGDHAAETQAMLSVACLCVLPWSEFQSSGFREPFRCRIFALRRIAMVSREARREMAAAGTVQVPCTAPLSAAAQRSLIVLGRSLQAFAKAAGKRAAGRLSLRQQCSMVISGPAHTHRYATGTSSDAAATSSGPVDFKEANDPLYCMGSGPLDTSPI